MQKTTETLRKTERKKTFANRKRFRVISKNAFANKKICDFASVLNENVWIIAEIAVFGVFLEAKSDFGVKICEKDKK